MMSLVGKHGQLAQNDGGKQTVRGSSGSELGEEIFYECSQESPSNGFGMCWSSLREKTKDGSSSQNAGIRRISDLSSGSLQNFPWIANFLSILHLIEKVKMQRMCH